MKKRSQRTAVRGQILVAAIAAAILLIGSNVTFAQSNVRIIQRGTGLPDKVLAVTTAATGTNWTTLPSQQGTYVLIINDSGTDLQVRYASATTNAAPIPSGAGVGFNVANNSNELQVRRKDTSNTPVTVNPIASR